MEHQTKIARILGPEIGLNFVTGFLGGHTLSRYIAKKIIRLGFFTDTQADYSLADGIGTGVLDQFEVGYFGEGCWSFS